MEQYTVTGMSCAACQARVEKAVSKVEGVDSCSVSLLTNSMGVEGSADPAAIIRAVENAGYGAALKNAGQTAGEASGDHASGKVSAAFDAEAELAALEDKETPVIRRRLIVSAGFILVLMYFSMGHMMFGWPIPSWFDGNHVAMGLVQLLLAGIVMIINGKFFTVGFKGLLHGAPNMDTLVALGSSASFVYSTWMLFLMTAAQTRGDAEAVMDYMDEFYFESAAMILVLISVGKMLEARSKGKTTDALKGLMRLAPKTATVERDGVETKIPVAEVKSGDIFVVRAGESIPVDGVVLEGTCAVNEAALTGESIPVDKESGSTVSAATMNQSGFVKCRATRVGEDTTLSQIIRMVSDAAATKAPIAKLADKVSGIFVPAVIGVAAVTFIIWMLTGAEVGYALARAISVLVISCPCALGLATPVAIMVGSGMGAKNGILYKTAAALEAAGRTEIVALDKTGTITTGKPAVTDVVPAAGITERELLELAYAVEFKSEHPLAGAVTEYAEAQGLKPAQTSEFKTLVGSGVEGLVNGRRIYGGNLKLMKELSGKSSDGIDIPALEQKSGGYADEGKTPLFFAEAKDGELSLLGIICVADGLKPDAAEAVAELKKQGIEVVMLTGDNERTANAIGRRAGVDRVVAGVLPGGKEEVIRQLATQGKVAMVGDGINDAPALTRADIGIAVGAGSDIAIDAADIVLMKDSLRSVPASIRLGRATLRNIRENLFWAFIYNVIGIPLAAGAYVKLFGWSMNPMFGAAAMSLSSFCVVTNALRLNLFKVFDASKDRPFGKRSRRMADAAPADGQIQDNSQPEGGKDDKDMKTMYIDGMMCTHCEARVKKALEAVKGVVSAEVSHDAGTARVLLSEDVPDDVLKKAVEDQDYEVKEVR
jgi:Cu2+-exporting ATPase